jgi:glyceraldehyde 3-phosphate dehydrogenase
VVDIVAELEEDVTVDSLNAALKEMAEEDNWLGKVLDYSEEPLVSTDYIGHSASSTIDALSTDVMGNLVKVVTWYDNEWGYSVRLADLAAYVAERL